MILVIVSALISVIICYVFSFYYSYLYSEIAKKNDEVLIEYLIKKKVIISNPHDENHSK